jgi:hypothetical protein
MLVGVFLRTGRHHLQALCVFFGVGLQVVMVLALVGVRRVFKAVFNKLLMPFGSASMLIKILDVDTMAGLSLFFDMSFALLGVRQGSRCSLTGCSCSSASPPSSGVPFSVQAGFTNMLTIVFFGVVLQAVMVLALVGFKGCSR